MAAKIEIWCALGKEIAAPARLHMRGSAQTSGLPHGWRTGERARFARSVLTHYGVGKPALASTVTQGWRAPSGTLIHVSLSDTRNYYVVGVGMGAPLGIDAEAVRPVDNAMETLERLGLNRIAAALSTLAAPARNHAFLRIWTAFESYLKLERLEWEDAAQRFAALEPHWSIGRDGGVRFQRGRAGLVFEHVIVENKLVIGIATPISAPIKVAHTNLPLRARASSGIASPRVRS